MSGLGSKKGEKKKLHKFRFECVMKLGQFYANVSELQLYARRLDRKKDGRF